MNTKKLSIFVKTEIILSLISIIITVLTFSLLSLDVIKIPNEEGDLGTGIAIAITIIYFLIFSIFQGGACFLMIAEAGVIKRGLDQNIFRKKLILIGAIIKLILACAAVPFVILCSSVSFLFGAFAVTFFMVILIVLAVFGLVCRGK